MRIVIIQTAFLGDVILTSPLLEALHQAQLNTSPENTIDYVLRRDIAPILEYNPHLENIIS